jgi:2-(acetamidomethylene)succinate hydrolase
MSEPRERLFELRAGRFRALEWAGEGPGVLFLHGLAGVAEVWGPTIEALRAHRLRCVAIDQRGHGHSARPAEGYGIGNFVADALGTMKALGLERPHLVGHSMGARVAMVLAARHPEAIRSVAIVDIGPEEWKANWQQSVAAFDRMPASWPDPETAIGNAGRARPGSSLDSALSSESLRAVALARLRTLPDGCVEWLADREALKKTVVSHRSRNYWRDWEALGADALFIRGGDSNEVRAEVAAKMRTRNPRVRYAEFEGVGHNIPLLAPSRLAAELRGFWESLGD